jgi:LETM1 and EF-hand domain-containing protein 1
MSLWLPRRSYTRTVPPSCYHYFFGGAVPKPAFRLAHKQLHLLQPQLPLRHRETWSNHIILAAYARHSSSTPKNSSASSSTPASSTPVEEPALRRIWVTVKDGAAHYWDGTKLLGTEMKISSRLLWKVLHGGKLTRREKRQVRVFEWQLWVTTLNSTIPVATTHDAGSVTAHPLLCLRHCSLHGTFASRRREAIPEHAALNL